MDETPAPELNGVAPYRAPATPRQEILCELFAQVLGVERCGLDSDFVELSGHPVEAMVLAGRISTVVGIRVSIADLYTYSSVGDLDHRLDQRFAH